MSPGIQSPQPFTGAVDPPRNCHSCHSLAYTQAQTQMQQLRSEQAPQGSTRNSGTSASRKHPEVPPGPHCCLVVALGRPAHRGQRCGWPPPTRPPVTGLLGLGPVWGFAHMLPQFPQLFLPKPRTREVSSSPLHLEPTHRGQRAKGKGCDGPTHLKALSTPGGGHGAVPFQVCGHRPLVPWTTGDPCSPPWLPVSSSASRRLPRDESAQAAVVGARASTSTSGLFSLAPLLKKKEKKKSSALKESPSCRKTPESGGPVTGGSPSQQCEHERSSVRWNAPETRSAGAFSQVRTLADPGQAARSPP